MSFRKRNVVLGRSGPRDTPAAILSKKINIIGVRPSPIDGRPTTSTGAQTLDDLLGGHAGLALGQSLLIEENGTTDFSGSVLRFFAAEGVVQEHYVDVVGFDASWGRDLPGLVGAVTEKQTSKPVDAEKMKIAWRYERLGNFGEGSSPTSRGGISIRDCCDSLVHNAYINNIHCDVCTQLLTDLSNQLHHHQNPLKDHRCPKVLMNQYLSATHSI